MVASERLAEEAARMRRAPGITFMDEHDGRRAKIAGTGIDVWEIVRDWQACGRDFAELRANKDWLDERQLRAALDYYALYPEEIDRFICEDARAAELIAHHAPLTPPYPREFSDEIRGQR